MTKTKEREYFCPEYHTWLDRSGFTEKFCGDYQEQLCKLCGHEVYHKFDSRTPQTIETECKP
ncbi:MAG TPA: hypothetical protein VK211_29210 [Kamptonema sp.]|nr:hypothetical protein [Kamptonema sp.]